MPWPVSIQICTLNEEANIADCVIAASATKPAEILVIDGGSSDRTVEIARGLGAKVIEAGPIGLAQQRRVGYQATTQELVAFVDADDRPSHDWLETMSREFEQGAYSALQSQLRVPEPKGFWLSGWNEYFRESVRPALDTKMVGRPALYRRADLLAITSEPGMIIEDTEMSKAFESMNRRQGIGHAISYRLCPDSYGENIRKWVGYGRGYRQFTDEHPDRRAAIWKHIAWTIPVARSVRPVLRGHLSQPAFGALMALSILRGYYSKGL